MVRSVYDTPIDGPEPLANDTLSPVGTSVQSIAAPENTLFAVVTFAGGAGFVDVGDAPVASPTTRYIPEGVPSVVGLTEGQKIAAINLA